VNAVKPAAQIVTDIVRDVETPLGQAQ